MPRPLAGRGEVKTLADPVSDRGEYSGRACWIVP
jgi:hypothetical protein